MNTSANTAAVAAAATASLTLNERRAVLAEALIMIAYGLDAKSLTVANAFEFFPDICAGIEQIGYDKAKQESEKPAAVIPAEPIEPSAPMTAAVLDLLRKKGAVTSIEAEGVLRCRHLPTRIRELKDLGHKIVTELKHDHTGQRYARYHLAPAAAA